MTNALATVDLTQLPSNFVATDEVFNELAKSVDYLGRLQLYTKGKAIDRGTVRPGQYGIPGSGDEIQVLGDSIDILVIARRPKAIDMSDKDAIITSYDPNCDEFKRIAAQAGEKESNCMYGVSFYVIERSTGRELEFYCGTKSSRSEAQKLYPFLPLSQIDIDRKRDAGVDTSKMEPHGPLPCTLKSKMVEKGNWSWHVPVVLPCSTPFTKTPPADRVIAGVKKFLAGDDGGGVEKVSEEAPAKGGKKRAR